MFLIHLAPWLETIKEALFGIEFLLVQVFLIYHLVRALFFRGDKQPSANATVMHCKCGSCSVVFTCTANCRTISCEVDHGNGNRHTRRATRRSRHARRERND